MTKPPKELNIAMNLLEIARELEVMGTRLITKNPTYSHAKDLEEIADSIDQIRLDIWSQVHEKRAEEWE